MRIPNQAGRILKNSCLVLFVLISAVYLLANPASPVFASGLDSYSGNNASQYYCPLIPGLNDNGTVTPVNFQCKYSNGTVANAIPKPPSLKVLQYWFAKVIFILWAFSGLFFTGVLILQGARYMFSAGDTKVIEDVKKKLKNWFIGLALVFLSYPVLRTVFASLNLNASECYSQVNLPTFQFFFANACMATDCTTDFGGTCKPDISCTGKYKSMGLCGTSNNYICCVFTGTQ